MADETKTAQKKTKKRSPAYPAINLETAINRANEFYAEETDSSANINVALGHWGYGLKSSPGFRVLSALKQYGLLVDEEGTGKDRSVKLTQLAKEIILDERPDSKERLESIRKAALSPAIFKTLWEKFGNKNVSDENLAYSLKVKEDFNPKVVNELIQLWRETFVFAKLAEADILPPENGKGAEEGTPPPRYSKDKLMQPQFGYTDYTLSLGGGKDIILRAPKSMTEDDFEFMTQWLKRLGLAKSGISEQQSENDEKEQE